MITGRSLANFESLCGSEFQDDRQRQDVVFNKVLITTL
jgi:hypothetical protein